MRQGDDRKERNFSSVHPPTDQGRSPLSPTPEKTSISLEKARVDAIPLEVTGRPEL